jgi:predicted SnoaL-like aldol condensation-catalyzing enzyme
METNKEIVLKVLKGAFIVVAEGDLVMVHGHVGWGPKPLVAVDIFKVKDGKVVEHWDVMRRKYAPPQLPAATPMFTLG